MRLTSLSVNGAGAAESPEPLLDLFPTVVVASRISSSALRGVTRVNGAPSHVTR